MYYLYYAGMAADRSTEQIGLATSSDGIHFERFNGSGLLIAREPGSTWKDVRVCNPTVVRFRNEWLMFYQGAHTDARGTTHAIGLARSPDGVAWLVEPEPLLSVDHMRGIHPGLDQTGVPGGVIEPAVVVEGDALRMWFVCYAGSYHLGTRLYCAESTDGLRWKLRRDWIVSSLQFGRCSLHYPQVVRSTDGEDVWFSLRERETGATAICRMALKPDADGNDRADMLQQVLPLSRSGLRLAVRQCFSIQWNGQMPRGIATLNLMASRFIDGGRNYFGYAHSHFVDGALDSVRMYYHAYHYDPEMRSTWMDIGSCRMVSGATKGLHDVALARSADPAAWDAFFVADPFVIRAD